MTLVSTLWGREVLIWPDRREVPCKDLDLDCFAFDGIIPFGDYRKCHTYDPQAGRCIFRSGTEHVEQ